MGKFVILGLFRVVGEVSASNRGGRGGEMIK